MPLSRLQASILKLIAPQRSPHSYVAGGVPINLEGPRFSADIDIFHDSAESVADAAHADMEFLRAHGMAVDVFRQIAGMTSANISLGGDVTKVEWVADSNFRYFPPITDPSLGYVLHPADLAVNKLMAAAGRHMVRDVVDLVTIHERTLPLGAIAIAAVVVAPGFTPESLLEEVRRNARYAQSEFAELDATAPIDGGVVLAKLRAALGEAERFVRQVPSDKVGRLFLADGKPVLPELGGLGRYVEHEPRRGGHWPG